MTSFIHTICNMCLIYILFSSKLTIFNFNFNLINLITIFSQPENHVFFFFSHENQNNILPIQKREPWKIEPRFRSKVEDFSQVGHRTHHSYCRYLGFYGQRGVGKENCGSEPWMGGFDQGSIVNGGWSYIKRWMGYVYNYMVIVV